MTDFAFWFDLKCRNSVKLQFKYEYNLINYLDISNYVFRYIFFQSNLYLLKYFLANETEFKNRTSILCLLVLNYTK